MAVADIAALADDSLARSCAADLRARFADYNARFRANFAGDQATLDTMFERFERNFEALNGHLHEIDRVFRNQADLDLGPILPVDEAFAGCENGTDRSLAQMQGICEDSTARRRAGACRNSLVRGGWHRQA